MDFPDHFQHIFKQLNHQRLHGQLCDCVVVVGGQSFQAHRSILAACSSHFRALLCSTDSSDEVGGVRAERNEGGNSNVVELDAEVVTPEAFSTLLDMIYTSTLSLGSSNVMDVLLAASHLHLNTVVKTCKLHLSRKNFPSSPPKGWRSVQQQKCPPLQQVSSASDDAEDVDEDPVVVVVEVSQSGRSASSSRYKRKSNDDRPVCWKRSCTLPEENYKECSPTVSSRSIINTEDGEDLLSPDCLKMTDQPSENQSDTGEEKYRAFKGESEEIQLPSQSDSGAGGADVWKKHGETEGDAVIKINIGEKEEEDETKMAVIEIKKENLCSYSPDLESFPSPLQVYTDNLNAHVNDEKMAVVAQATEAGVSSLQTPLCSDLQSSAQREAGDLVGDSEGLDSLSELTFSCFLNPNTDSVMGALEEEESLISLTATATTDTSDAATAENDMDQCQNSDHTLNNSPAQTSDSSSSSLIFPVSSVPLQQFLPPQNPSFSDTLILQPTQNSLAGFLSNISSGLSLEASLIPSAKAGKSSGATTFRRIAPKVAPGTDPSSASAGDAADRPSLTRASEDVLSKCKKAAAEDHVLLVEGEKKYACNICCKTFMNLTDCKKHIRVHTGEKPYPCPKCGKRFSQSSHLYKHSKNSCLNWKDDQSLPEPLL